ncbi:hypothetical protein [Bradyrhizobium sp. ARR65]|uniref:hypothetical protein n=1 Tax=Bradyrhizobium sp. ARR65 TaxID=1040989 RepID=UPI000B0FE641|nr:hypothetical protein [Bradyrhizobium sp. ARR65]
MDRENPVRAIEALTQLWTLSGLASFMPGRGGKEVELAPMLDCRLRFPSLNCEKPMKAAVTKEGVRNDV